MNIIVCIKQVPDTADIKWTKNNTIQREGIESIINPYDEFAIETAIRIKEQKKDTKITALSMGPKQAEGILKEAMAVGCDDTTLICDKKFAGSDTIATSNIIAKVIKDFYPDFDIILCGQFATDGDTAQTGPAIAEKLKIPQVTYVTKITEINEEFAIVEKEGEYGFETIKVKLPALLCIQGGDIMLRPAKINGYIYSQTKNIPTLSLENIDLPETAVGLKGSPTYVSHAYKLETNRSIKFIQGNELLNIIKELRETDEL